MISTFSVRTTLHMRRGITTFLESSSVYVFAAIFYRGTLEFSYWAFINPKFAGTGFVWNPNHIKYIESWICYLVLLCLTPRQIFKPSDFFLSILLFTFLTPLLAFYGLADQNRYHLYIILLGYILILVFRKGRPIHIPSLAEGKQVALFIMIASVIIVSVWITMSAGFSHFNFNFSKIYVYRGIIEEKINIGLIRYANSWTFEVFGTTLIMLSLWRKKFFLTALIMMLHVFWFGITQHKSVMFTPLLPIFVWMIFRKTSSLNWVPLLLVLVIASSTIISLSFNSMFPATLFPRRSLFVPARNTFDYYEFFSNNPKVWWSNTSFNMGFIDNPYDINPANLIGEMRGVTSHRNNSFLSTGYMHAGITGIVLYAVLVGLLFRITDSLAFKGLPVWVILAVLFAPYISLILSSDLPTALLTHGIGIGLIILFLLRSRYSYRHITRVLERNLGE